MVSTSMTLNDPEFPKEWVRVFLAIFGYEAHLKSVLRRHGWR